MSERKIKVLYQAIGIIVIAGVASFMSIFSEVEASTKEGIDLGEYEKFLYTRQVRVHPDVSKKVLTFYYPWYGNPQVSGRWFHWEGVDEESKYIASSTHYPVLGPYDSNDPEVVAQHMRLFADAGVDGIIVSWWGVNTFEDKAMPLILDEAKEHGIEVSVYLESEEYFSSEGRIYWTSEDLRYILKNYGPHPAFLQVDGAPVVFVYSRVMGQVSSLEWMSIIQEVEKDLGRFLLIADGVNFLNIVTFDGVHDYNPLGMVLSAGDNLREAALVSYERAVSQEKAAGKISTVTIIPGYDDTKIRKPGIAVDRKEGRIYRTLWEAAIEVNPDWVLITSFNEWHEGSQIEPSLEFGDEYMKLTGEYTAAFKAKPSRSVALAEPGADPFTISVDKKEELKSMFVGKTIGVLPELSPMSPIVLWLSRVGLNVKLLSYEDVVEELDPERYQVLVYAGGENYRSTFKELLDVDNTLVGYLHRGGIIFAAPSLPWPFYYNEKGTVIATEKFGIPVDAGWESPPDGLKLIFKVNSEVIGDFPELPFPAFGDLRWRPARPTKVALKDEYVPFVSLYDETGKWYGDGAAYAKHVASTLRGGQAVYVWFRLMDQPLAGELLYQIFKFVGERLGK